MGHLRLSSTKSGVKLEFFFPLTSFARLSSAFIDIEWAVIRLRLIILGLYQSVSLQIDCLLACLFWDTFGLVCCSLAIRLFVRSFIHWVNALGVSEWMNEMNEWSHGRFFFWWNKWREVNTFFFPLQWYFRDFRWRFLQFSEWWMNSGGL